VRTFFRRPAAAESVLAGLGEGAVIELSMLQMRLGGAGSLDVLAVLMRLAPSTAPVREITGRRRCCLRHGDVKTGELPGRKGYLQIAPLGSCSLVPFLSRCFM
jgi:hypothetical protein